MDDRTVSKIVDEVSTAIWDTMQPLYLPQPTTENARRFEERWQFPHSIGALVGKHIMIKKPAKSGSSFFNYKQTFSVVLMATIEADYKFINIDVGSMGRFSDGGIFPRIVLVKNLKERTLQSPPPALLPTFQQTLTNVLWEMKLFRYKKNIMRPYPKKLLLENMKIKFLITEFREHSKLLKALLVYEF